MKLGLGERSLRALLLLISAGLALVWGPEARMSVAGAAPACEFGQGASCASSADCKGNTAATLCAGDVGQDPVCQIPCGVKGKADSSVCSMGETCVAGVEPGLGGGDKFYCKASKFSMDLNLLDACVFHFIEGLAPDLSGANQCSLANRLSQMLDQDGNRAFNIYDVDLCIRAFLDEPACSTANASCSDGQTYCAADADCGTGLHCDTDLHKCTRECGIIVDREAQSLTNTLDRKCAGSLKTCDYDTGTCADTDLTKARCQVNQDCPSGAYCFVGSCQPRCYRSLDCPGSDWYCGPQNECLPRPKADPAGKAFNPKDYSVQLARSELVLDPIQNAYDIPLLVMNLVTKAQVFNQPNAVFGYRLELTDYRKLDDKCRQDLSQLSSAAREAIEQDCTIGPDEEFITLASPFGTVYGTGDPTVSVSINSGIANKLTAGMYQATLSAIFSNGSRSSTIIRYRHPSPSGEYSGRVSVYAEGPKNLLGTTNLAMRLYMDRDATKVVAWDDLLAENKIAIDREFEDVTIGYRVTGKLHGSASMMFNWPAATNDAENEIPLKGIYVPQSGRLRLIGVVDYEKDFCRSENGKCNPKDATEQKVYNSFGRKIRRTIEFIGPFNADVNRFSGVYRETYAGLAPSNFTLDGGFILDQQGQDETALSLAPLLAADTPVSFPTNPTLATAEDQTIAASCPAAIKQKFLGSTSTPASQAVAFKNYLSGFDQQGGPIFEQLTRFEDMISTALSTMQGGNGALTLDDYLKGSVKFCEPGSTNCIKKEDLDCGLALYRKAWLNGWIDTGSMGGESPQKSCDTTSDCTGAEVCAGGQCRAGCATSGETPTADPTKCGTDATCEELSGQYVCIASSDANLFCKDIPGRPLQNGLNDCAITAAQQPALVALQDHNRFYRELVQTNAYQAGARSRDAFFAMFRAANGDALDESSAYQQKLVALQEAVASYDAIQRVVFNGTSAHMLFNWPMNYFATRGQVWLKQMHATIKDRMETLLELVDHRRRVLKSAGQQDFLFAKHVLYQEYLQQVFLMGLQRHWQRASFDYAGNSQELMTLGDQLLAKTKDNRNPLGLHPNRIYFENADLASMNWQNFRNRLVADLQPLKNDVSDAIANLKGVLADQDKFKGSLLAQQQQIDATITDLCGDDTALPAECNVTLEEKKIQTECQGQDCPFTYKCDSKECDSVIKAFDQGTDASHVACRADTETHKISVEGRDRLCVRGRVGALLQERVSLDLQRGQITRNVQSLVRQIARQQQFIAESESSNEALNSYLAEKFEDVLWTQRGLAAANAAFEMAATTGDSVKCMVILGLAEGTDCVGAAAGAAIKFTAIGVREAVAATLNELQQRALNGKETHLQEDSQQRELRSMRMTLDNLLTGVDNYVASYSAVTQQLFNLNVQIDDALFQAQRAADRNAQVVTQLIDTLVGRESGSVLVSNRKVQDSNARFQKMLVEAYKMTRAFVHRFNLDNQSEAWSNRVYQIVTIKDLEEFIAFLDNVEQNYCGAAGLDCDYVNNGEVFEFSIQKQLFPSLRDIVDPNTGKVLTVGQQFHNLITSSGYVQRRARPYGLVSQIEIPFAIWLNDRGANGGAPQRYMVGPGDCNHIIRGSGASGGTVAVNVVGTRIPKAPGVKYELWRGNTDYIRSCNEKVSDYESKINTYIVGWTPTSSLGQLDSPPSFYTQSGELAACLNNQQLGNPSTVDSQSSCFKFFARDRSLGAPDYQLVIPQIDRDQAWILGDGLAADEKPIIEDIVLYFRYNDRPITGN
ncbi:MAG TPA: hypothetical protein VER11_02020 [Polyangiaceae bacterium]|nr:hypothetical protein [Polyangiaceae bacterium]